VPGVFNRYGSDEVDFGPFLVHARQITTRHVKSRFSLCKYCMHTTSSSADLAKLSPIHSEES
jgi:hypothetical protein